MKVLITGFEPNDDTVRARHCLAPASEIVIRSLEQDPPAEIVHIPALPQQVIKYWSESPFMPLEMVRKAISSIAIELLFMVLIAINN